MIFRFKKKPVLIIGVILISLLLSWIVGSITEQDMRNSLIQQTRIGANSIDVKQIKNLTGTSADLKSPDYLRLKQQFANILKVDKHLHFIYLMGVKKNGKVFFYVDDKPDGDHEGSPPGSPYDEAPKEFNQVMLTGIPVVQGPSSDSWGSYASGCAPVVDPQTGKIIAIFAIDFATSSWYWEIFLRSALPVGLVLLFMLGLISYMVSRQKGVLLKNSEEKYRFMFHNNPQPNWIYDLETLSFLEVNQAVVNTYGYSKEEFLSMTLKDIHPDEDLPALLQVINGIHNPINDSGEWRQIKKDGKFIFVEISSHKVIFNGRNARHVLVHDITMRKQVEIALYNSEVQLRKFASHLQNVREEEKVALAREIHDDLGQILVSLKIDMGLLKQKLIKTNTLAYSEEYLPKFDNILDLIDNTIKTTRRIMNGLRPELLELYGLAKALKEYLREFEDRHQIKCEYACDIYNIELSTQQSLAIFRILQEAMSNIAKHAKANSVKIQLKYDDNKLCMEIIDNGVGFENKKCGREDSYGILGIKERTILLNGKLDISSKLGLGTCVRVEIPYKLNPMLTSSL